MKLRIALLAILAAVLVTLPGCDSADNPIAPTGSVITITANPTQISLNGQSSAITITGFRPDGNPLNPGTQLTLSTSTGVLRKTNSINGEAANVAEVQDGRATVYLFGDGRQGTATITAGLTSGGDAASATVDVQIGDDDSSKPTVEVTANPTEVDVNQASTITVQARNADGSPLTNTAVNLRTSLGTLDDVSPTTDSNGQATTALRSSQSGQAVVTASVGSSDEMEATVEIGTTRKPILEISVSPATVDSGEEATVSLTVLDNNRNLINERREVFLDVDEGNLRQGAGGTAFTSGSVSVTGRGTVIYTAGETAGQATISGFVGNSDRATASLTIRTAPATITVQLDDTSIDRNPNGTEVINLTARVQDEIGDPLGGEIVTFVVTTDAGNTAVLPATLSPPQGSTTGPEGIATATLSFSGEPIPAAINLITINATVRDISTTDPALINVTGMRSP